MGSEGSGNWYRRGKRVNHGGGLKMSAVDDLDQVIEQFDLAQGEFVKGNPEPMNKMFSHREDVTLNNPFSPPAHGWEQVAGTMERAASQFRDGEITRTHLINTRPASETVLSESTAFQKRRENAARSACLSRSNLLLPFL
jgi:hypothetical protein